GVPVRMSRGDAVVGAVDATPALVVATPGAEPRAAGGYAGALLLDGHALLTMPGLRTPEEALRRWLAAAALERTGCELVVVAVPGLRRPEGARRGGWAAAALAVTGGEIVVVAEPTAAPVQALVRGAPAGFAERELAERQSLRFPPVARVAELTGAGPDIAQL